MMGVPLGFSNSIISSDCCQIIDQAADKTSYRLIVVLFLIARTSCKA
jgi:hypothetical protein